MAAFDAPHTKTIVISGQVRRDDCPRLRRGLRGLRAVVRAAEPAGGAGRGAAHIRARADASRQLALDYRVSTVTLSIF